MFVLYSGAARANWGWVGSAAGTICRTARKCAAATWNSACWLWGQACQVAGAVWAFLVVAWAVACRLRAPLLIASGAGLVIGLGCYLAGPVVASAFSGLTGFAGVLASCLIRNLCRGRSALDPLTTP